ncbi:MAG: site-2 protease family protein [Ruminococcaceae bacterium]|nr:site-2 protease family protein [Oscillospiraceae bacterium]
MSVIGSILTMLIMLSILVVVHEWGHYIVARIFKVKVNEFSIFMGPAIYSRVGKKTGTKFSIRCIPLGGYCAMADENGENPEEEEGSFFKKPKRVRAAVFVAGAAMNILLGLLIIVILFSIVGYQTNEIGLVTTDGLFATYEDPSDPNFKIEVGDKVVSYDGYSILNGTEYSMFKSMDEDYISVLEIKKPDGTVKKCTFDRTPESGEGEMKILGMNFIYIQKPSFFGVLAESFKYLVTLIKMVIYSLYWLITGTVGLDAVAGPVGMTAVVGDVITAEVAIGDKILTLLNMAALISVNLGIFNLIPFPGLDGGQLALVGVEALRGGKKLPPEKQGLISFIGLALLVVLAIVVMGNDIWQLVSGGR